MTQAARSVAEEEAACDAAPPPGPRLFALDAARGLALAAMVLFHFGWDLDYFGFVRGLADSAAFRFAGHAIAAAFLLIVGAGLALASRKGFAPRPFLLRLATIVAAAALVTIATWIVFPREYIFFGILHCIAAVSLAATPFLFAPPTATFAAALLSLAAPLLISSPALDAPALQWLGLGTREPVTNDWAPFFPAFGFVLLGLAAMRLLLVWRRRPDWPWRRPKTPVARLLTAAGRRSLVVYLIHQPLLFGLVFVVALVSGRSAASESAAFVQHCSAHCAAKGGEAGFCARVCGCVAARARTSTIWNHVLSDDLSPKEKGLFNAMARECVASDRPPR